MCVFIGIYLWSLHFYIHRYIDTFILFSFEYAQTAKTCLQFSLLLGLFVLFCFFCLQVWENGRGTCADSADCQLRWRPFRSSLGSHVSNVSGVWWRAFGMWHPQAHKMHANWRFSFTLWSLCFTNLMRMLFFGAGSQHILNERWEMLM